MGEWLALLTPFSLLLLADITGGERFCICMQSKSQPSTSASSSSKDQKLPTTHKEKKDKDGSVQPLQSKAEQLQRVSKPLPLPSQKLSSTILAGASTVQQSSTSSRMADDSPSVRGLEHAAKRLRIDPSYYGEKDPLAVSDEPSGDGYDADTDTTVATASASCPPVPRLTRQLGYYRGRTGYLPAQMHDHKVLYTTTGSGAWSTSGTFISAVAIAQGSGFSQRLGDTIYVLGFSVEIVNSWRPYTAASISQWGDTAAELADANHMVVFNEYVAPTAGSTSVNISWSANNPPNTSDSPLVSFGAQGSILGNQIVMNAAQSRKWKLFKYHRFHLVPTDLCDFGVIPYGGTAGGASVAGTLPPRLQHKQWYFPVHQRVTFNTASSDAKINLMGVILIANASTASRNNLGYQSDYNITIKTLFRDVADD